MRDTNGKNSGSVSPHAWRQETEGMFTAEHGSEAGRSPAGEWPTAGWSTAEPERMGMDSGMLADTIRAFRDRGVRSLVVVRAGMLVAEAYGAGLQPGTPQDVRSVTKSIVSMLAGAALADGRLRSVEQRISDFYPELKNDPKTSQLRIKHLLSMTSGLAWNNAGDQSSIEMMHSEDWVQYILERPAIHMPGRVSTYSNGDAHLLSAVLQQAVGMPLADYAQARLFGPLGITDYRWNADPQGIAIGAWAMALTPRDMAKLGWLYLKGGEWDGARLLPKKWVRESLQRRIVHHYKDGRKGGYGYYWWLKPLVPGLTGGDSSKPSPKLEAFYAAGSGGQRIFVIPALELVAAFTAESPDGEMPEELLNGIVRSIRSETPLQANPEAACRLTQAVSSFKAQPQNV
ncbi:putative beta-lactamase [Paenibacillus mucilaginosus 3016]|uniref:Putative beta-lactamase n=1 Tax=Paenibacillus mucilaginosus 3016 TaxID=1116391 RepID=H6NFZ9_9BACL|nr:serine hydrolase [Paenibacillus mucilaginosus]AFC31418.1 putative beta-lactamase [Paenibacillus mucilaginosus 3016]WFA19967.1 serine hydrolase [Paenibacillus mucilaginosus]